MYSIPGLGMLPDKMKKRTLSRGFTAHQAQLCTIHIYTCYFVLFSSLGEKTEDHWGQDTCLKVSSACCNGPFMPLFILKSVNAIITYTVTWAMPYPYLLLSRCSIPGCWLIDWVWIKSRAHDCCGHLHESLKKWWYKLWHISLPRPFIHM